MHEATNKNVLTKAVLAPENHGRQHTTKAPHVKAVVIHLVVDQQLWTLRRNSGWGQGYTRTTNQATTQQHLKNSSLLVSMTQKMKPP